MVEAEDNLASICILKSEVGRTFDFVDNDMLVKVREGQMIYQNDTRSF